MCTVKVAFNPASLSISTFTLSPVDTVISSLGVTFFTSGSLYFTSTVTVSVVSFPAVSTATTSILFFPLSSKIRLEKVPSSSISASLPLTVTASRWSSSTFPSTVTVSRFDFSPSSGLSMVKSGATVSNVTVIASEDVVSLPSTSVIAVSSFSPSSNETSTSNDPSSSAITTSLTYYYFSVSHPYSVLPFLQWLRLLRSSPIRPLEW